MAKSLTREWGYVLKKIEDYLIEFEQSLEVNKDALGRLWPEEALEGARRANVGLKHQVELDRL